MGEDIQSTQEPHAASEPGASGTMIGAVENLRPRDIEQDPAKEPYEDYQARLRQAEEALRRSEEHLRMVVDGARDYAIFMVDPQGIILTWNTGAERMKQWLTDEILGRHFSVLYRPEDREMDRPMNNLHKARAMGMYEETYPRMKKDGTIFIADVTIHAIWDETNTQHRGFSKVVRDVTDRQQLLQRLVMAQENERRRISRELHDQTAQHLAALSLGLKSLEYSVPTGGTADPNPDAQDSLLLHLRGIAEELASDIHRIAVGLRPTALDDMGLIPALLGYVERWSATTGIPVEFNTFGLSEFKDNANRFSDLVETTVYRVVQEALTNVSRHAGNGPDKATIVEVTLQRFDHRLQLTVEDNGPGFDVDRVGNIGRLGVAGMKERAAACGGTLEIESAPGEGTTVFLRIPIELL